LETRNVAIGVKNMSPNAETITRLVEQAASLLENYHAESKRSAASRETEFWRGNISGFRHAVREICGQEVIHGALADVRKKTSLEIPPIGELDSCGKFVGPDSEADF
jgi:hypothetical protein